MTIRILKVQKPIFNTEPIPGLWLFYDEHKQIYFQTAPTPDEIAIMGEDFKMYAEFECPSNELKSLIRKRVEDQPW